jgi:C4-dicarboxylate-specific signal transduction histidine kinase
MTTDQPPFNLDDVVGNSKLERRLSKPPHYEAESNALIARTQTIAAANEASQFQIGERKRAEDQLQQLNNELERRVTDRTRDLINRNGYEISVKKIRLSGSLGIHSAKSNCDFV